MAPFPDLPVLGVCLPTKMLGMYRDWIIEDQRDLEIQDFFDAALIEGDWKAVARQTLSLLQGYRGRLGIHGPFWGFSIGTTDQDVRKVVQRRLNQGLDACAEIGATQMVIHSPYTTWAYNNLDHLPGARQQVIEDTSACLEPVVARAEDLGVVLVIENIEDKDPHARVALARQFDSASVRVSVDTGHANYAHYATGAPPVDHYILAAGEMLHHVHIQDTDGFADRHWAPGKGNILWSSVFEALAKCGANPRLNLELREKEEIPRGAAFLQQAGLAR